MPCLARCSLWTGLVIATALTSAAVALSPLTRHTALRDAATAALAGLALYVLLPVIPVGPVGFIGVYVVATSIGLASHIPGGLGVFEGAMVLMLPELPMEPLIAAMLAYRLIYYLGPLALATTLFAGASFRKSRYRSPG